MKLICESCDHGYTVTTTCCPWCGAGVHVAHESNLSSAMDTECYKDFWLIKFDTGESFMMFPGHDLDISGVMRALSKYTIVTFNGINYDMPITALALSGYDCATLKWASDKLILDQVRSWDLLKDLGSKPLDWVDHIDMMNVAPGAGGLKSYGGKMHVPRLQDLPIEPDASIRWYERGVLSDYCSVDLHVTRQLYIKFASQIKLRTDMGLMYGLDLRSKSDAQIAEAVMKSLLNFKVQIPSIPQGTQFYYKPPAWVKFQHLDALELLARNPFGISDTGTVEMSEEWATTIIKIGDSGYQVGSGGLHSTESSVTHVADSETVLVDFDVTGYYPSIIINEGLSPFQIGGQFNDIYKGWRDSRTEAKAMAGRLKKLPSNPKLKLEIERLTKEADTRKILNNGTFGKLGSRYSIFYAPCELIQVTVTGQLALLMLIEIMELCGITVISANTDGIILKFNPALKWLVLDIVRGWEAATGFEMEETNYRAVYSRDVNNYIAVKTDGEIKRKGMFAPAEPAGGGWPAPAGDICVEALIAYLTEGVPIENTIRSCKDFRKFIHLRTVKGGGKYHVNRVLKDGITDRTKCKRAGSVEEYNRLMELGKVGVYLGKVVRWYYSVGSVGTIRYKESGNLVSKSEGCSPCMDLPVDFPDDIDYERYVLDTEKLIVVINNKFKYN